MVNYPDVDVDGIPDYRDGCELCDYWLVHNGTTLFIGPPLPIHIPVNIGSDTHIIFIDSDDNDRTGYVQEGRFGADHIIQMSGREGVFTESALYQHVGGAQEWNWSHVMDLNLIKIMCRIK